MSPGINNASRPHRHREQNSPAALTVTGLFYAGATYGSCHLGGVSTTLLPETGPISAYPRAGRGLLRAMNEYSAGANKTAPPTAVVNEAVAGRS